MPYRRKKPFHVRYQAALINVFTVLLLAVVVLAAVLLSPKAVEHLQNKAYQIVQESRQ